MKFDIKKLCCQVCGTQIPPGGIFYIGRTEIISGSDGFLPDTDKSSEEIIEKALHANRNSWRGFTRKSGLFSVGNAAYVSGIKFLIW